MGWSTLYLVIGILAGILGIWNLARQRNIFLSLTGILWFLVVLFDLYIPRIYNYHIVRDLPGVGDALPLRGHPDLHHPVLLLGRTPASPRSSGPGPAAAAPRPEGAQRPACRLAQRGHLARAEALHRRSQRQGRRGCPRQPARCAAARRAKSRTFPWPCPASVRRGRHPRRPGARAAARWGRSLPRLRPAISVKRPVVRADILAFLAPVETRAPGAHDVGMEDRSRGGSPLQAAHRVHDARLRDGARRDTPPCTVGRSRRDRGRRGCSGCGENRREGDDGACDDEHRAQAGHDGEPVPAVCAQTARGKQGLFRDARVGKKTQGARGTPRAASRRPARPRSMSTAVR